MREINVNLPKDVLKVNLGDKSFTIPLGSALPLDEVLSIKKAKDKSTFMEDFMKKYIPEDIYKTLTMGEATQIFNAWSEATKESSGMSMGES